MVVAVSSSPSSAAPSDGRTHPTYKEMVVQALTELRDPGGSSRHAIGKYIADHFTGLHSSHEELLSAHLRRLIFQGQLRLVSGNYFLNTEASPSKRGRGRPPKLKGGAPATAPGAGQKRGRGRPRKNSDLASPASIPSSRSPKRGPGRPRKNSPAPAASSASPLAGASASPPPSGVKRGPGRPRKNPLVPVASSASPPPGVVAPPPPSTVKRGRGRPRKNSLVPLASSASPVPGASVSPTPSGVKRGRGRPRKVVSSSGLLPQVAVTPPPSGVKRGRGRPPKNALILLASSVPQPGAITPPLSGVKRGRGRPRKNNALVPVASSSSPLSGAIARPSSSRVKRGHGRPRTNSYPVAVTSPLLGVVAVPVSSVSVIGAKRGRGRPPKAGVAGKRKRGRPPTPKEKKQPESVQSADAPLVKRGPGRPRKEKTVESGHLNAAQMSEDRHDALPAQAVDQAGAVQIEVEAGSLQSFGTSLTEKRGRGRPRKRPLETETAETGVAVLAKKRGVGRPRKKNLSGGRSTGSALTASGIKRGRGRPRKARPFETGPAETAVEVSGNLAEVKLENDDDLASGTKSKPQDVILVEEMDALPADDGCVLVSGGVMPGVVTGEETTIAPMDAGGAIPGVLSGEEAAVAPMDAGAAMPGVDLVESDVGTKSH
ncbi:unnamed protein product [Urochloa humidicola]